MTEAERELFRKALADEGWYGVFRVPEGLRREPIVAWRVGEEDNDTGLTRTSPAFNFDITDQPLDVLGRYMMLGVFHPEYQPEPEGLAIL
jgi:hypothetical protein